MKSFHKCGYNSKQKKRKSAAQLTDGSLSKGLGNRFAILSLNPATHPRLSLSLQYDFG
jgi:hypothetical protein